MKKSLEIVSPGDSPKGATGFPTGAQDRVVLIDAIRGFALLGILLINMHDFLSPDNYIQLERLWPGEIDKLSQWFCRVFVAGKFFTMYSFLFGLGLSLQMDRLEARGARFVPIYLRRQGILFFMGLIHGVFIWSGDILLPYSLYGCLLALFRKRPLKLLLLSALLLATVPIVVSTFRLAENPNVSSNAFVDLPSDNQANDAKAKEAIQIYSEGSFAEIMNLRMHELIMSYNGWFGRNFGISVFTMFLLGLYAGRKRILVDITRHRKLIVAVWRWGLGAFLISVALSAYFILYEGATPYWLRLSGYEFEKVSRILVCLFYVATFALLSDTRIFRGVMAYFSAPGRMGLTNYLLQSLVCTTIFYSYGFGLYGTVSPALSVVLSVIFFAFQVIVSRWFLQRFNFGPMEWIWKSMTYGAWQNMRKRSVKIAASSGQA